MSAIKIFKRGISLSILLFGFLCSVGQINVYHVSESTDLSGKKGFFYALPQTVIRVDVTVVKHEHLKGPYAEYAAKYLDLEDVIMNDYDEYEITGIELNTIAVPDPSQYYFAEIDPKAAKDGKAKLFSLTESGLAMGLNGTIDAEALKELTGKSADFSGAYKDLFKYFAETNLYEETDTIIKKVVVDTAVIEKKYFENKWVEKSDEQKAIEAANMISKIRESRFNLLTGYQEVAYDAGSITYMDGQLKQMEWDYLTLFTGLTIDKTYKYTFTALPKADAESTLVPVFSFSERNGVAGVNASGGEKVNIKIEKTGDIGQLSDKVAAMNQDGKDGQGFYYRIPETAIVSLKVNKDIKVQKTCAISQLGVIASLPANASVVQFHPETGGVRSVIIE
jgi:hypothetical protein